jgi:TatD DNase family protein
MLYDAHNHLQDPRLVPHLPGILHDLARLDFGGAVVNGTRESDWPAVAALAAAHPWVRPAFGLHPWQVSTRSPQWMETLSAQLVAHPHASIGEIGLDRWIKGHDLDDQITVFTAQLQLAVERDLPVTCHCIQAWGALWDALISHPVPARGFLIHAYGGALEMIPGFAERGAYFSFSPYFLHPRKAANRDAFRSMPPDRILVETDAPDLRPPDERNLHPLHADQGEAINHPANLSVAYSGLAETLGMPEPELRILVARNFTRLFDSRAAAPLPRE